MAGPRSAISAKVISVQHPHSLENASEGILPRSIEYLVPVLATYEVCSITEIMTVSSIVSP